MEKVDPTRRRAPRRVIIAILALCGFVWLAMTALASPELPDFRGEGTAVALPSGGSITAADRDVFSGILAGQHGRVVVVNVWASWCAPCRAEMPLLQAAADDYAESATFIGVASNDQLAAAETFLADVGVNYPNVFDRDGSIARALGVSAYPTTYVFGVDGAIRARVDGGISEQRLAGLVLDASR